MERLLLTLKEQGLLTVPVGVPPIFIVALGEAARAKAFVLQQALRARQIAAEIDLMGRSMKGQMKAANKAGAGYTVIIGEEELARQEVQVRNMMTKEQIAVPMNELVTYMESNRRDD